MGNRHEQLIYKRGHLNDQQTYLKVFNLENKMQNKTTMRPLFYQKC